ncbi:Ger(x)C family spore germination protein [Paenibacillus rigui]|nr:Ger(x)C family spore germination protein [Paenibacillus rigui]
MTRMMRYKVIVLITCLSVLTGCWDRVEINDLALVMAGGLDLGENGQVEASLQIAIPQSSTTGQGGGKTKKAFMLVSETGKDGPDSLSKIQKRLSRKISFGHRGVLVIGEAYARHGLDQVLDQLTRSAENRYLVYVLTAHGTTAKQILKTSYLLESIPATALKKMQSNESSHSVKVDDFLGTLSSIGKSPVTGAIRLSSKDANEASFQINEAAVYREGKLVGFLTENEMKILQWERGKLKNERIQTQVERKEPGFKGTVSIVVLSAHTAIQTRMKDDLPEASITFKFKGRVVENDTRLDLSKGENIKRVESKLTEHMEKQIKNLFLHVQKQLKSDIFGLGEQIHIEHGADWKKIKNQWNDIYPQVPVNVKVEVVIERIGRTQAPAQLKN